MSSSDTIAACATASGPAAVSVLRISGPDALPVADRIFEGTAGAPSRRKGGTFTHGIIRGANGRKIDDVLLLVMKSPHSYTGEDVVEIHGHGGSIAPARVLRTALDAGCRPAEPGEFTRRAFLNGKLDLLQAEGICDLIKAGTDRAAQAAIEQLEGSLSERITAISNQLFDAAVSLEAALDFPDDELPPVRVDTVGKGLETAESSLSDLLAGWEESRRVREGATVVLAGRPNVGKSTLFNVLLGHARAIVTPYPGTTRDTIEESLVLGGIRIRLIDTAGLRETDCPIEREGVSRTRTHVPRADLMIHLLDASREPDVEDRKIWAEIPENKAIIVLNKRDLGTICDEMLPHGRTSILTRLDRQEGVEEVRREIVKLLGISPEDRASSQVLISERHRAILQAAHMHTREARKLCTTGEEGLMVPAATHLRAALDRLGEMTGRVYHDDVLDGIFSRFCIGK